MPSFAAGVGIGYFIEQLGCSLQKMRQYPPHQISPIAIITNLIAAIIFLLLIRYNLEIGCGMGCGFGLSHKMREIEESEQKTPNAYLQLMKEKMRKEKRLPSQM